MLSAIELLKQHDEMEFASKKEKKEHHKEIMALVIEKLSEIQETIEDSPEFQAHVHELLKRADMKDLQVLFKTGKIKTGEDEPIDKVRAARLIAGVGGISFLSWRMDKAISLMPTAIPGLSKGAAGFFIMSFFSSAGEFLVSKKYMERGADEDAGKNITDSNAINIGLAQAAMATSAARSGMAFI